MDSATAPGLLLPSPTHSVEESTAAWHAALPAEAGELLPAEVLARLYAPAARFLHRNEPDALLELQREMYAAARVLEERVGHHSTLYYLRDGLAWTLETEFGRTVATEPLTRVVSLVTDAVWEARANILEATIQRQQAERLHHELMLAKRIQERLLPRTIPEVPGFDIAGHVKPAAEVGGDYWSCKWYPEEGVVTLKLADVTGHGIAAATLVAAVKFISGGYFRGAHSVSEVMERTNRVLVKETPQEIMVTMVYGWLHPSTGDLDVVNAGHSPVLHYQNGVFHHLAPTGLALGMLEKTYREVTLRLEPGDIFVTCSDGITAPSADGALGEEWVEERVRRYASLPAAEIVRCIIEEAEEAYGRLRDDMSVLVLKRNPLPAEEVGEE